MRIGLLHYTYAPVVGGVERVLGDLHILLKSNGHEAELIQPDHPLRAGLLEIKTLPHFDVLLIHNVMTMPFDLPLRSRLMALAQSDEHCQKTRLVNWVHDVASVSPSYSSLSREVRSQLNHFEGPWTHVAVSKEVAQDFHHATGHCASVIPNGIYPSATLQLTSRIANFAEMNKWWPHSVVLLLPARLVRRKRIEDAIRLVEVLSSTGTPADLLITGAIDPHTDAGSASASYGEFIEKRIGASPARRHLHLLARDCPLSPQDVTSLYQLCDAVILPSESEGFGLPALESAIHGKPFLCNPIGTLSRLPGTTPVDLLAPNPESALTFIKKLAQSPPLRARKSVLSQHHWQSIYERAIAPLILSAP